MEKKNQTSTANTQNIKEVLAVSQQNNSKKIPQVTGESRASQPTHKELQKADEYTASHLQGGLQLVDLVIRKMTRERCQKVETSVSSSMKEAEERLTSLQQQYASFTSHENSAADSYRGHRVNTPSNSQPVPINNNSIQIYSS